MMDLPASIAVVILLPLLGVLANGLFATRPNLRDISTLLVAVMTFFAVLDIYMQIGNNTSNEVRAWEVVSGLSIAFRVEPLGLMFAMIASGLWIITHIYGVGYMRGGDESNQPRFFACFCVAISAVMGIALASNLFTLFLFYEILTISTYPLVAHKGTKEAIAGARTYLGILIGTSIALFLLAIVWTFAVAGTTDFTRGGILGRTDSGRVRAYFIGVICLWYWQGGDIAFPQMVARGDGRAHARVGFIACRGGGEGGGFHDIKSRDLYLWHRFFGGHGRVRLGHVAGGLFDFGGLHYRADAG